MSRVIPAQIGVCADDFGYHDGVNSAALELASRKRISAIACMAHGPAWRRGTAQLREIASSFPIDVGLHLDLTEPWGQRQFRLSWVQLVVGAYAGILDKGGLLKEIRTQLDAFEAGFGRAPDFIDGHRHVHQLPVVRRLLVTELKARYPARSPWLRRAAPRRVAVTSETAGEILKSRVVAGLGAQRLSVLASQAAIPQNQCLLGMYSFDDDEHAYVRRLIRWLGGARDGDLLVCHPASSVCDGDELANARMVEYRVLASSQFTEVLASTGAHVVRMSAWLATQPL